MKLQVAGMRSLAEQEIVFEGGLNLLTGANAQGKSSVLESVYLLGTTRSFRTSRLGDIVAIGGEAARIAGEGSETGESLAILVSRTERGYLRAGKPVAPSQYIGTMDVIALSSDLLQKFRRLPSERRRFLDRMALATRPGYLEDLRAFRRASAQRGLLAAAGRVGADRDAWDERTASLALPIARSRHEMSRALDTHLREASRWIFPEGSRARVALVSRPVFDPADERAYRERLVAALAAQRPMAGRRVSPAGPSRDDLSIEIDGSDLLRFGSSGQIRSLLAAAALAEMNRLRLLKGRFPVLVLDDVDSDLDEERYAALLGALGAGAQVFAASSKGRLAASMGPAARRFTVSAGVVALA